MSSRLARVGEGLLHALLTRPRTALTLLFVVLAFFAFHTRSFRLDASADSLLLENDADLQLYRQVSARYETLELLIVTFTPKGALFGEESLLQLKKLRDELRGIEGVDSVTSILDVPLVKSADVPLLELAGNVPTLEGGAIEPELAAEELNGSPVFRDLIVSEDNRTTAVLINLARDEHFASLLGMRNQLLIQQQAAGLSPAELRRLGVVTAEYDSASAARIDRNHRTIARVRSVIDGYRSEARIYLGGVPMIADDMVTFVRSDLVVFGSCVLAFLIFVLTLIFRQLRWVALPLLTCFYASLVMIGMLGLIGWRVTVISSNFLALMLIVAISMNIHLAVRYQQLRSLSPSANQYDLVSGTMRKMVWPCLYTALTTIIGFGSLVLSDIKPVRDFGWMMSAGLAVVFLTSFTLFPVVLVLLDPRGEDTTREEVALTAKLASATERHGNLILVGSLVAAILAGVGISRITVENSFIDYFRQDTEIYQGMRLIDDELGGTTPLEVLLSFEPLPIENAIGTAEEEDEFDEDFDLYGEEGPEYWFTPFKIERIKRVHDYLDGLPEVGKVLSLASVIRVAEELNEGKEFEAMELPILYKKLPETVRGPLIDPYVSVEHNEARIMLRILDSKEGLRRKDLLDRIHAGLSNNLELADHEVSLVGTLVLYNNMLQSLFGSQISSLGAVMLGIAVMFLILFRSVPLAVIGIVPNLLAAAIVLGLMGWIEIPLDVMTITIASITIGIAVDNGIHYIYRFREEFALNGDYVQTLHVCHATIGRAVFYTSTAVIFGFSILMLSRFLPTIYFGVLTGIAMGIAFLASLTLLPRLILLWRPFGKPGSVSAPR